MSNENTNTAEREIASTRVFEAPRELVWKVWTDPEHLGKWWGPNGFTTTTKVFELKLGGQWLFVMHGPDGTDYRNEITFSVIIEPERLEYDHGPSPNFHTTVIFDEENSDKTKISMTAVFPTKAERDRTVEKFHAIEGMKQTLGRLADYLAEQLPVKG